MAKLDRMDVAILEALQEDARLSNQRLADKVGLSPSACWRRVKSLEDAGVIDRYVTLVSQDSVGLGVTAFLHLSLENHQPETVEAFDRLVADVPEIMECYSMSGQDDYLIRVVAATLADYERLMARHFMNAAGLRTANSSFVLKQKKYTTVMPLKATREP
ncbi:MAG: Lrp/AsnC family transcriptional regulator [Pseudomonadota bacterium]